MTLEDAAPADTQPILDAASILLVDTEAAEPRLLMGLRQAHNVFLPNKWVFPGGRLERSDADGPAAGELQPGDAQALMTRLLPSTPRQALAKALARAAVRELFEETGHALAAPAPSGLAPAEPDGFWGQLRGLNLSPNIAPLRFIARAITPPGRTRRYDTRFFYARRADVIEHAAPADNEFADVNWFTIADARTLDLPSITRRILADLESLLTTPDARAPVPFYYEEGGLYRRDLIARA